MAERGPGPTGSEELRTGRRATKLGTKSGRTDHGLKPRSALRVRKNFPERCLHGSLLAFTAESKHTFVVGSPCHRAAQSFAQGGGLWSPALCVPTHVTCLWAQLSMSGSFSRMLDLRGHLQAVKGRLHGQMGSNREFGV